MALSLKQLNIVAECKAGGLTLFECPPFLFIIMGIINIASTIATYQIATRAIDDPEYVIIAVFIVATLIFIVGGAVVLGFNKVVEANQVKSEFIGIISHQLRSPLSIFKWTLGSLQEDLQKEALKTDAHMALLTLNDTNERMIRLVNMLLEVNRIESNRFVFQKKPISLNELTEKNIAQQKNYADSLGITITFSSQYPGEIVADEDKLQMAIQNLLDNAIRYSKKSGTVTITIARNEHKVTWTIADQGLGIPEKEKGNIFSKFFRGKSAMNYQSEGNGIGLYIVKKIIEEHGGKIGFTSEENRGATFWFTLPLAHHAL